MTTPRELPSRRNAPVITFELRDGYAVQRYAAQYAEFEPGDLAEVFLAPVDSAGAKPGLPLDNMAKDLSVLFSIARRYGAPVDVIRAALSQQTDGKMLGPLGEFLRLHAEHGDEPDEPEPAPVEPRPTSPFDSGATVSAECT